MTKWLACFYNYNNKYYQYKHNNIRRIGFCLSVHHRPKGFWTNVCRLLHKRRKGLCLTPKQQFRLMRQGPFLLCLCQRGAFTAFQMIFLFCCSFEPKAESHVWPRDPTRLARQIKPYFLAGGLSSFTQPAMLFLLGGTFFTDFSFEVFYLICLYFRLPPFSCLSVSHIRQSFSFWA